MILKIVNVDKTFARTCERSKKKLMWTSKIVNGNLRLKKIFNLKKELSSYHRNLKCSVMTVKKCKKIQRSKKKKEPSY